MKMSHVGGSCKLCDLIDSDRNALDSLVLDRSTFRPTIIFGTAFIGNFWLQTTGLALGRVHNPRRLLDRLFVLAIT